MFFDLCILFLFPCVTKIHTSCERQQWEFACPSHWPWDAGDNTVSKSQMDRTVVTPVTLGDKHSIISRGHFGIPSSVPCYRWYKLLPQISQMGSYPYFQLSSFLFVPGLCHPSGCDLSPHTGAMKSSLATHFLTPLVNRTTGLPSEPSPSMLSSSRIYLS